MFGPECGEFSFEHVTLAPQRIGVTLGFVGSGNFHGGLGHDRTQACVFGFVVEEFELFVGDGKLGVGLFDAFAQIEQTSFDGGPRHGRQCTRWRPEIVRVPVRTGAMRTECIRDFASDLHS